MEDQMEVLIQMKKTNFSHQNHNDQLFAFDSTLDEQCSQISAVLRTKRRDVREQIDRLTEENLRRERLTSLINSLDDQLNALEKQLDGISTQRENDQLMSSDGFAATCQRLEQVSTSLKDLSKQLHSIPKENSIHERVEQLRRRTNDESIQFHRFVQESKTFEQNQASLRTIEN